MSYARVAAVTGANKGIGLAIVRRLTLQYAKSPLNTGPLLIYLTARDPGKGAAALQQLEQDHQVQQAKASGKQSRSLIDIKYRRFDISEGKSIDSFRDFIQNEHPEGIDVLVNNAGVALNGFDESVVEQTLRCNYYGTLKATESMLPLMKPASTSRIVNLGSMVGKLNKYTAQTTQAFRSASSPSQTTDLMASFQESVRRGTSLEDGWPSSAYAVSKAGVIGMTKAVAEREARNGSKVLINSCCPGYVQTDMTKGGGRKSPDQGAQTPVMLALDDLKGQTGLFWEHEEVSQW